MNNILIIGSSCSVSEELVKFLLFNSSESEISKIYFAGFEDFSKDVFGEKADRCELFFLYEEVDLLNFLYNNEVSLVIFSSSENKYLKYFNKVLASVILSKKFLLNLSSYKVYGEFDVHHEGRCNFLRYNRFLHHHSNEAIREQSLFSSLVGNSELNYICLRMYDAWKPGTCFSLVDSFCKTAVTEGVIYKPSLDYLVDSFSFDKVGEFVMYLIREKDLFGEADFKFDFYNLCSSNTFKVSEIINLISNQLTNVSVRPLETSLEVRHSQNSDNSLFKENFGDFSFNETSLEDKISEHRIL